MFILHLATENVQQNKKGTVHLIRSSKAYFGSVSLSSLSDIRKWKFWVHKRELQGRLVEGQHSSLPRGKIESALEFKTKIPQTSKLRGSQTARQPGAVKTAALTGEASEKLGFPSTGKWAPCAAPTRTRRSRRPCHLLSRRLVQQASNSFPWKC